MVVDDSIYQKIDLCLLHWLYLLWKNESCHACWWFMPISLVMRTNKKHIDTHYVGCSCHLS